MSDIVIPVLLLLLVLGAVYGIWQVTTDPTEWEDPK